VKMKKTDVARRKRTTDSSMVIARIAPLLPPVRGVAMSVPIPSS